MLLGCRLGHRPKEATKDTRRDGYGWLRMFQALSMDSISSSNSFRDQSHYISTVVRPSRLNRFTAFHFFPRLEYIAFSYSIGNSYHRIWVPKILLHSTTYCLQYAQHHDVESTPPLPLTIQIVVVSHTSCTCNSCHADG